MDLTLTITDAKFRIGASVLKIGKYKAYGRVRGFAIGEEGNLVYVVEHKAEVAGRFMHIYSGDVLELHEPPHTPLAMAPEPAGPKGPRDTLDEYAVASQGAKPTVKLYPEQWLAPELRAYAAPPYDPNKGKIAAAKARGYTGDCCNQCGSFNTVRTGTCLTCSDCGSNEGCG